MTITADNIPPLDKETVADIWRVRAPAWNKWVEEFARMAERFNEPLVDAAQVATGHHVLDLASGTGEPAITLARRVGPTGSVIATDLVDEMLEGTRLRAASLNLDNLYSEVADMENLPFGDARFDRAVCRFGIMFAPDADRALSEVLRVLKPDGRTAWMVWGPMADNTVFDTLHGVVRPVLGMPPATDLPQFRFAPDGMLGGLMSAAGFTEVAEQNLHFQPHPKVGSHFWRPQVEMTFGHDLVAFGDSERAALDDRIAEAFDAYRDGDVYRLTMHVRIGTGVKAS